MQRAFIVKLELDPSADIAVIEREMTESLTYDFPEIISVKAWNGDNGEAGPRPIEGEIMMGQTPLQ